MTARIAGIATAVPAHAVTQHEARAFAADFFAPDLPDVERLLEAFDNTGIAQRQFARPLAWYGERHGFPEKNRVYRDAALDLGTQAAERVLTSTGIARGDIGAILFVSSTGLSTPSLDAQLIQRLGLSLDTVRVPLWGLGCAGGAAGLARAADLTRALGKPVLLVCVEVCSTTFVHDDRSKANLIATALFGDGAAAVLLTPGGEGPAVIGAHSHLVRDSDRVMGWTLVEDGLQVVFAVDIPPLVRRLARGVVDAAAHAAKVAPAGIGHYVLHPGGPKVLDAYTGALQLAPDALRHAVAVLRDHGNMSSPSVLFVLERFLDAGPAAGELALLMALGPGFAAESVVLRI